MRREDIQTMAMQTWEYQVVDIDPAARSQDRLNELGAEGWELVAVSGQEPGTRAYLKRPRLGFKEQVTLEQREKYARLRGERQEG